MEKDIDELLEEVENKFINESNDDKSKKFIKTNLFSPQSSFTCDSSDYEDILRDVDDNTDSKSVCLRSLRKEYTPIGSATCKCFPLYLGGSKNTRGCSTIASRKKACNNLHCVTCDFAVYSFDGFQWSQSTEYLFLRTNMPDFERLKSKLIATDGCCAYACQCRHYSTSILQQVQSVPMLSWVCGSHSTKSAQL
ncbi:hypothetical protein L9F63_016996 [Diploptera punctata]|uniref:Cilia- and flagella-associated protein 418 n=1 Tax=Diploptera punctata TaxID=6984 RepID=A0AAD7ZZZ1_DIPPU|nr:hypothetical protein L9F63_016996 [Diploptera punctata]